MNTQRLARVIGNMEKEGLSQILVSSTAAIYYLTGIWNQPFERMYALYIDTDGKVVLFGNEMFSFAPQSDLPMRMHSDDDDPVADLAGAVRPGKLGIDKFWPSKFLISLMAKRPDVTPVPGSDPVDFARMQKDADEIRAMRSASQINDTIMTHAISMVRAGVMENEITDYLDKAYTAHGGDHSPDGKIASFGANAANPHHEPGAVRIQEGDCVVLDIFNPIHHYWCDMTRTVFFGRVDDESKRVYEAVRKANLAAEAVIAPGRPMSDFDATARKILEDAGYGPYFTHRLGHGIGLECHEIPDNSASNHMIALPGMTFSVEPGAYIPGKVGVRIEDLVLVTETGCEVLNHVTKDLTIVG